MSISFILAAKGPGNCEGWSILSPERCDVQNNVSSQSKIITRSNYSYGGALFSSAVRTAIHRLTTSGNTSALSLPVSWGGRCGFPVDHLEDRGRRVSLYQPVLMMSSRDLSQDCLWAAMLSGDTDRTRCLALRETINRLNSSSSACYNLNIVSGTQSHFCMNDGRFWTIWYDTQH